MTQRWGFSALKYRCASLQHTPLCCCLLTNALFLGSFSPVSQRQCFHNSHHFPLLPTGHKGGRRTSLFLLSMLIEAGTFISVFHPCQITCIAFGWLLSPLHSTPGPHHTHARSTVATRQSPELALQSRHPRAVVLTSFLGIRLQSCSCTRSPGADVGVWQGAAREHQTVTADASPMDGCAAGAGLSERGSPCILEHGSLFHPEMPETVRWSFIIDLIHI